MSLLSSRERERYSRQMMLFGEDGQELLKEATIFIAGAGGLGSPVSMYLAILGVGTIIIADNDAVERTNLNRQILHAERDIGRRKAVSAGETLEELNPDITIKAIDTTIDATTIRSLTDRADGIVDALDNYPTRYLLNAIAVEKDIPFFHGGISGFFGQATTILPGKTPCLRCIFPNPPPREVSPVTGMTAGFIGMVQATEVCKYLLHRGDLLANRLLLWDGMQARVEEIPVEKDPSCGVCAGKVTRQD
jgi:adenylyltransferase/sulfurtransferase